MHVPLIDGTAWLTPKVHVERKRSRNKRVCPTKLHLYEVQELSETNWIEIRIVIAFEGKGKA